MKPLEADYLIFGEYVLAMDEAADVISDGAVAVRGNRIVEVGPADGIRAKYPEAKVLLEGRGKAVMPGLVNTHTHAAMALMRGMADDIPLKEWLEGHIWPAENRWLSPEFVRDAAELACLEMLKGGVTAFCDMYFFQDVTAEVVKEMGMRASLGAGVIDFPTRTTTGADDCLRKAGEFISKWKGDDLIVPCVAPHSAYGCSERTLRESMDLAQRHGVIVHTHVSETEGEVRDLVEKFGERPFQYLDRIGFLNDRLLAAHCVWVDEDEIALLAERGVKVAHCAESNLKLASGIAPVAGMLKAGIKVSLGTDGAASNNDLNILGEAATAAKLQKAMAKDPTALDARTAMTMATLHGAAAMGLEDAGALRAGNLADIVVMDLQKPHLTPLYNVYSHLVYAALPSDVHTVIVNGRVVVEAGEVKTADEEKILHKARQWAGRISAD